MKVTDNTYFQAFILYRLMDKLGVSAKMGLDLVVRQTYFGFCFALVDENFLPRPVSIDFTRGFNSCILT